MIFPSQPEPRIFALPIGCDFSKAFIAGLLARLDGLPPEVMANTTILVNTRRSQRRLEELLSAGPARLLPDIKVIGDLSKTPGLPAAKSRFLRHLALADLVGAFLEHQSELAPKAAMFGLAESLADLQDEMAGEQVSFETLAAINPQGLSGHWQRNLEFLDILNTYTNSLPEGELTGNEARQRAAVSQLAAKWEVEPPQGPVILAGSTGSRATTSMLMKAVLNLPQGAVVLPGFDFTSPSDLWENLGEEHPQFGFASLGKQLGFDPATMQYWHSQTTQNPARNALVSLALRPAPVTPHWLDEAPLLAPDLPIATQSLTLLSAPDPRFEALAISIRLREALALGQKAALVTPDRNLTRRVAAELSRWDIQPDDSAGRPAKLTPPGIFLRMVAHALGQPLNPVNLMEILKHPLCAAGSDTRNTHLEFCRRFENKALRAGSYELNLAGFEAWKNKNEGGSLWLDNLNFRLTPVIDTTPRTLARWASLHQNTAEALAGKAELWDKEAGKETLKIFETLKLGESHQTLYSASQYRSLFATILERLEVRDDPIKAHPDIAIWGTLEARVQSVDLVIVAGLNEGTWPKLSTQDPWLNRDMRKQCGLMLPERQIGLSAHDFQQALGAAEVVISRCLRDGEAPSVASRWLMRLQNLIGGMEGGEAALEEMTAKGNRLLALAATLDQPANAPVPAPRPCPAPPLMARPRKLSVTRIETLIRDPYAIYAQKVLGLYALKPLKAEPTDLMRGVVLHEALENFVNQSMEGLPSDPEALFNQVIEAALAKVPWPADRSLWRHHYNQARAFFLESETERRALASPFATEVLGKRTIKGTAYDVTLTAKADRIDITPAGTAIIYDYKAGTRQKIGQIKAFSVQLPLEGAIAASQGFEGLKARLASGLELIYFGKSGARYSFAADDPVMNEVWERVIGFINLYQNPEQGYSARLRPEISDFASDYDHLSRFGEWLEEDPATPEELI